MMHRLQLERRDIESLISPWIIREYNPNSFAWRRILFDEYAQLTLKLFKKHRVRDPDASSSGRPTYRTVDFVKAQYDKTWSRQIWPTHDGTPAPKDWMPVEWGDRAFVLWKGGIAAMHLELIARTFEQVKPRTVLEVGAGIGTNLLALSTRFPDIKFTGVELTEAGAGRARSFQALDVLPDSLISFLPWEPVDREAFKRVRFCQGNATRLDFPDDNFDLIMTKVALEQMEAIRAQALTEISRVGRKHTVMIEPFADFNRDPLRRLSIHAKKHFSLPISGLEEFDIKPQKIFSDWPMKTMQGVGFVLSSLD